MFKKIFFISMIFFSTIAMAKDSSRSYVRSHAFLSPNFNIANYKKCNALMTSCPFEGIFYEISCVNKILKENKVCHQFKKLSDHVDANANTFYMTKKNGLVIANQTFPADGQSHYYIIANDTLIDTNIDPRTLNQSLKKKYNKKDFYIVNWGEPTYQKLPDGSQKMTAILKVTDTCLACSVISWAKLEFNFTKTNAFVSVKLRDFSKKLSNQL